MSTTIDNEEAGQNLPVGVDESKQLVDAPVQLEASPFSVPVEKISNHVENVKVEAPAEVKNLEPGSMAAGTPQQEVQNSLCSVPSEANAQVLVETVSEDTSNVKSEFKELPLTNAVIKSDTVVGEKIVDTAETVADVKPEACGAPAGETCDNGDSIPVSGNEPTVPLAIHADTKAEIENGVKVKTKVNEELPATVKTKENEELPATVKTKVNEEIPAPPADNGISNTKHSFLDVDYDGNESGTEMEQSAFMKELENFFRERSMEFKPPKFYGEGLNCLKLWRAVTRLGGYDKVTTCKLWRQVGESFKPPKTCTTVSWTFRGFYEKALLDYERHKTIGGELTVSVPPHSESINIENQASASGRARRDAAARAMQGWHSQRLLGNGEVSDPIIKDRTSMPMQKREKQLKSINLLKRKKPSYMDNAVKAARSKPSKPQLDTAVVDIGPPADWVKINVQKTKDCFEVYALVPGLLREEVRVQSDPAGRLVISGEPEHPENPWGVTPFKKVVSLPSRIDPHQTSAVVTLHGQLFVRVPFEQSE